MKPETLIVSQYLHVFCDICNDGFHKSMLVYKFTIQTVIDMLSIPSVMPTVSSIISLALNFQET